MTNKNVIPAEISASVIRIGMLDMQVCVPAEWSDDQVCAFAESENACGTDSGWQVRKDAESLGHDPERNPCSLRDGCVHVMLDA